MNHPMRGLTAVVSCLALLGLVACSKGGGEQLPPPPDGVTSVTVTPAGLELVVGATGQLTAHVVVTGTATQAVTWASADQEVATVDDDGMVEALAAGSTTITAASVHDPSKHDSSVVTVTAPEPPEDEDDDDEGGEGEGEPQGWRSILRTSGTDVGYGVAIDPQGHIIVVGGTTGSLVARNTGGWDAFVGKFTADGEEIWLKQFGTSAADTASGVVVDDDGNIYVVGDTSGRLFGRHAGGVDVFIVKYSPDGEVIWGEQFGTSGLDSPAGIALDGKEILIGGWGMGRRPSQSGFVRRYAEDPDGEGVTEVWTVVLDDLVSGIAIRSGIVFATGETQVAGHGSEVFVQKLGPDGEDLGYAEFGSVWEPDPETELPVRQPVELWEELERDDLDAPYAIAIDPAGNVYLTGYMGAFNTGTGLTQQRPFLMQLTAELDEMWALLFESEHYAVGTELAVDPDGNIVLIGNATSFYDQTAPPGLDMFTRILTPAGELLEERFYGESGWDRGYGLAVDADGNVFVTGGTHGDEDGLVNLRSMNVFVRMDRW